MLVDQKQIILRNAIPQYDEGLYFARYLDLAAEGFFRFMLGRNSQDILARTYLQPGHDLSYRNVMFAEHDARIVGMFCGFTAEQHHHSSRRVLGNAAGRWNLRMRIISALFAPMMRIIDNLADQDFYLQAIAIDADLQGQGIGSRLLDAVEHLAISSGAGRLVLDVSVNNENASQLYLRRGFCIESTWPKRLHIPALAFQRMVKQLPVNRP